MKSQLRINLPDPSLIADQIADVLREAIISGNFQLGEKLFDEKLASTLNVSRTPVRQALRILKLEGLVDLVPRKGTFVSQLTRKDAEELYQILGVFESFAVEQVIARKISLSPLEEMHSKMKMQVEKGNLKGIIQANFGFHLTLVEMVGNERLIALYQTARNPTRIFQSVGLFSNKDWMESLEDHNHIVEAICRGDTEAAVRLCREHNSRRCGQVISRFVSATSET